MNITEQEVTKALSTVIEPELHKDLITLNMVKDITIKDSSVAFTVVLTTPACPLKHVIEKECKLALVKHFQQELDITVHWDSKVKGNSKLAESLQLPIKQIIAVGSGKGGVGKSTVSTNIAIALAKTGAKVGLLDADLYGPNIPIMMGISELPPMNGEILIPAQAFGVSLISLGFLIPEGEAIVWRGPMLHNTLKNLLTQVEWGELDYLIVDLPPGTGDIQLSLAQSVPVSGAVIVSSPQDVALADAVRGIAAFKKLNVPVLGLIENMAGSVFGSGGGEKAANEHGIPFLGRIELLGEIREAGDKGKPAASEEGTELAELFSDLAKSIAGKVSVLAQSV